MPSEKPSQIEPFEIPIVEIPLADVTIDEAARIASDGKAFYLQTMPAVLSAFPSITPKAYWELSVAEHGVLVDWLTDG